MGVPGHHYRNGVRGRSITTRPGVGGVSVTAHLDCSVCERRGDVSCRAMMPPQQIDQKFRQHGWALDPHLCPNCRTAPSEEKTMNKPSAAAMKAQAVMFRMLTDHFDPDLGRFAEDWTDARIAADTGLAVDVVRDFRLAGFGEIKPPDEFGTLRADINALEALAKEQHGALMEQVAATRSQLATLTKRFAS